MAGLTIEQVEMYSENGYLVRRKPLFGAAMFACLRSIFEEHLERRGTLRGDELRLPHYHDPRLLEFLLADPVLDVVESLIGPDIALRASHFLSKGPLGGRSTPWHQDVDYFRRSNMLSSYDGLTTIWLALSQSNRENGCMRMIAGSTPARIHRSPEGRCRREHLRHRNLRYRRGRCCRRGTRAQGVLGPQRLGDPRRAQEYEQPPSVRIRHGIHAGDYGPRQGKDGGMALVAGPGNTRSGCALRESMREERRDR